MWTKSSCWFCLNLGLRSSIVLQLITRWIYTDNRAKHDNTCNAAMPVAGNGYDSRVCHSFTVKELGLGRISTLDISNPCTLLFLMQHGSSTEEMGSWSSSSLCRDDRLSFCRTILPIRGADAFNVTEERFKWLLQRFEALWRKPVHSSTCCGYMWRKLLPIDQHM